MKEKEHDNIVEKEDTTSTSPERKEKRRRKKRRAMRLAAWSLAGALGVVAAVGGGGLLFLQTSMGETWLTGVINKALTSLPSGLSGSVEAFHGPLPFRVTLSRIELRDARGVWLQADKAELRMDWTTLPRTLTVEELCLDAPNLLRLPETLPSSAEPATSLSPEELTTGMKEFFRNWPVWLPAFSLERLNIRRAQLPEFMAGMALQATLAGSTSLGRDGATLALSLERNDLPCPPVTLRADISAGLELSLKAEGSDLGLAALLPENVGKNARALFHLTGNGSPSLLKTELSLDLQKTDIQKTMLSVSGNAEFQLSASGNHWPKADIALSVESGPASESLWALTGQKNGRLTAHLSARTGEEEIREHATSMEFSTSLILSDMAWSDAVTASVFGKSCSLQGNGTFRMKKNGGMDAELSELTLQAERLHALMRGNMRMPQGARLSSDTQMSLHAECSFDNTRALSQKLSGSASFSGDIAGTLTALNTRMTLKSDKLDIAGTRLEKAEAEISVPKADIPRIVSELPSLAENLRRASASQTDDTPTTQPASPLPKSEKPDTPLPLLTGSVRASLRLNGQKTGINTLWSMEEHMSSSGRTVRIALDKLDASLESSTIKGSLLAMLPLAPSSPKPGTVAHLFGMTPPALDGSLEIRIPDWNPLARISKLRLSGSPLNMQLALSSGKGQALKWQGTLDAFRLRSPQGTLSLSGLKTDIDIRDMWNTPDIKLAGGLNKLKTPSIFLSRLSADVRGNRNGLRGSLQSHGDIRCETRFRWKPGECTLEKLDADIVPSLLGLSGKTPAGIRLNAPASMPCRGDKITVPDLSLTILPSGQVELSGEWSPKRISLSAAVSKLDLSRLRTFSQELPSGMVEFRANVSGTMTRPVGNLKLNLKDMLLPGSSLPPVSADITGILNKSGKRRQLTLALELPEDSRKALGLTTCDIRLNLPFTSPSAGTSMPDFKGPLGGVIRLAGELGQIWKLLPLADQRLSGEVNLSSELSGTMSAPELTLHASVDNGRFAELAQGVELRDIRLRVDADRLNVVRKSGSRLTLDFSAGDGRKGTATMNGWFDPTDAQLAVSGRLDHLSPLRRQDVSIMLSGTFGAEGSVNAPVVKADVTVDKGQIHLAELPGSDIVTLPVEEPGQKAQPPVKPLAGTMDVHVRIPNQFFIRGYGLECEWKGDIRARGPMAHPGVTGSVQAVRGGLDVLGKHFKLSEGRITFDGGWPVSPMLNIIMEYTASNITADVTVSGPATKPDISLSSQPAMPQDEIISQIMFGQSAGTLSHVQAIQLAAGAAQLAGLGGPDVMGIGRKILGLDVLKLNSDNTSDTENSDMSKTSLELGTYVLDNVYVGVEQGIGRESDTGAVVEIELTPSLEAQAKASSNRTEFGLEWKKNY